MLINKAIQIHFHDTQRAKTSILCSVIGGILLTGRLTVNTGLMPICFKVCILSVHLLPHVLEPSIAHQGPRAVGPGNKASNPVAHSEKYCWMMNHLLDCT